MPDVQTIPIPYLLVVPEGRQFLIRVPNYWGAGKTLSYAKTALKVNGGSLSRTPWQVWNVGLDTYVNAVGYLSRGPNEDPPILIAEYLPT